MLTIDGGGILGIVPAMVLAALEEKIKEKKDNPEARIVDYLDFIAGTSTGGIIVSLLNCPLSPDDPRPRYSAAQIVDFYHHKGSRIFKAGYLRRMFGSVGLADERYNASELETLLSEHFGDIRLSDLIKPCLIPAYNLEAGATYFFCKHDHDSSQRPFRNFYVRDLCRATSAAPSYFEPASIVSQSAVKHPFVDGGVFANNPTLCAIAEVSKAKGSIQPSEMLILSLGTGEVKKSYSVRRFSRSLALLIIPDLINIMMSGVSETTHHIVKNIFHNLGCADNYVRLSPEFTDAKVAAMDNASPANIDRLRTAADYLIAENEALIDTLAGRLIEEDKADALERFSPHPGQRLSYS